MNEPAARGLKNVLCFLSEKLVKYDWQKGSSVKGRVGSQRRWREGGHDGHQRVERTYGHQKLVTEHTKHNTNNHAQQT